MEEGRLAVYIGVFIEVRRKRCMEVFEGWGKDLVLLGLSRAGVCRFAGL